MNIRIKTERLGDTEVIFFDVPTAQDSRKVYLMPHEVIELLRNQFSMQEIADELGVSPFTVQGYRMRKPVTRRPFANLCQLVNKAEALGQFPRQALETQESGILYEATGIAEVPVDYEKTSFLNNVKEKKQVYSDRDTQKNGI